MDLGDGVPAVPATPEVRTTTRISDVAAPATDATYEYLKVDDPIHDYLAQRIRVSLGLADGTMCLSAVDVVVSKYGVNILLPLDDQGSIFIPKPGADISVSRGAESWECYFPGTHFEIPRLKLMCVVFVRKNEDAEHGQ